METREFVKSALVTAGMASGVAFASEPDGKVWGRPVGVAVGHDGALYVTDDGSRSIWRVTYTGKS